MKQMICSICSYTYDEASGVKWEELPEDWRCPICGAEKVYPCESVNAALDVLATDRVVLTPRDEDGNGQANE